MKNSKFLIFGALCLGLTFTACNDDDSEDEVVPPAPTTVIAGTWVAYDVSPLLAGVGITAITSTFGGDNTYTVIATSDAANTEFAGTYAVSDEANADGIYNITLNQTTPSTLTSEGIFKIYTASPDSMWYEVAQTNPALTGVTPPTADAGFGSTSGGAFGVLNIQKYEKQ